MENIFVTENETFIVIAGTKDIVAAEEALRKAEEEWYGKDHEEAKLDIKKFSFADIYYGPRDGVDTHYWGNDPENWFDGGKFETKDGFIGQWEDTV